MPKYTDNNSNVEWKVNDDEAILRVDHDDHYHDLDLSDVAIGDLYDNTDQILGDAHRKSDHYKK